MFGYDGRLAARDLDLEAAHIKWHAADGPDAVENSLALCAFHHVALDRGALSFGDDLRLLISQDVSGQILTQELLLRYSRAPLRPPLEKLPRPRPSFLAWHRRKVFRRPAR